MELKKQEEEKAYTSKPPSSEYPTLTEVDQKEEEPENNSFPSLSEEEEESKEIWQLLNRTKTTKFTIAGSETRIVKKYKVYDFSGKYLRIDTRVEIRRTFNIR